MSKTRLHKSPQTRIPGGKADRRDAARRGNAKTVELCPNCYSTSVFTSTKLVFCIRCTWSRSRVNGAS